MAAVKLATAVVVVLAAGFAGACAGGDDGVEPVASSSCAELLYEGEGEPDVIVVSDFPRRGVGKETIELMIDAIEVVLRKREFLAGDLRVGYQSCNDTVGEQPYDPSLCRRNARAYVAAEAVVGIIGPWNSGCAEVQIPIVSRRDAGPLAMISPSTTFIGLTRTEYAQSLYPDGVRSFARIITHDVGQGRAAAHLAKRLGARRVAVVHQDFRDPYVRGLASSFLAAARELGLDPVSFDWRLQKSYSELAGSVAATRPDVVYVAGLTQENANTLVEDLRAALPRTVELVGPDSFAAVDIAQELGEAGEGMFVTVPGIPHDLLPPAGERFARELGGPVNIEPGALGAPEAAQSAEVLLDAIGRSDGTRASVVEELFATKVKDGILGSFSFDRFGDIDPAPVGVYRFEGGKIVGERVVRAPLAATGG
jgi:branched-chain amino acid transport system substrate-binding protein